jgi:hypothetical protein
LRVSPISVAGEDDGLLERILPAAVRDPNAKEVEYKVTVRPPRIPFLVSLCSFTSLPPSFVALDLPQQLNFPSCTVTGVHKR